MRSSSPLRFTPALVVISAAAALCAVAATDRTASAYPDGPPSGYAGNPPYYENCTVCHWSYDPNSGDGQLQLVGVPSTYSPGETYPLQIILSDNGQSRWGFELTVIDDADPDGPSQGGDLAVTDFVNTQIDENYYLTDDYLKQTEIGSYEDLPNGPVSWSFNWTAPGPETESVTFYFCGNAANSNGTFTGDYIYVQEQQVFASQETPTQKSTWGRVKAMYR